MFGVPETFEVNLQTSNAIFIRYYFYIPQELLKRYKQEPAFADLCASLIKYIITLIGKMFYSYCNGSTNITHDKRVI